MTVLRMCLPAALLAAGLAGCSSTPKAPSPTPNPLLAPPAVRAPPAPPAAAAPSPAAVAPAPATAPRVAPAPLPDHLDPRSAIATERSFFFDFDAFSVRAEDGALVERHGRYLAGRPAVVVRIEGHTDERGGVEYNLALGQKRAEAVRRALRIQGVGEAQMEAVSWGESRPRSNGHDESAWAENRRADLRYPNQ